MEEEYMNAIHNAKANLIVDDMVKTMPDAEGARGPLIDIITQLLPLLLPLLTGCLPKPAKSEDVQAALAGLDPDTGHGLLNRIRRNRVGREIEQHLIALDDTELADMIGPTMRDSMCRALAKSTVEEVTAALQQ